MSNSVLVVGVGNWMYGDEAAGIAIATELGHRLGDAVRVSHDARPSWEGLSEERGNQADLIVFVTCAEHSDHFSAGTWCKIEFPNPAAGAAGARLQETRHVPSLLTLAQQLGDRGTRVWIYALAGQDLRLGAPLSLATKEAVAFLESHIENEIRAEMGLAPSPAAASLSAV